MLRRWRKGPCLVWMPRVLRGTESCIEANAAMYGLNLIRADVGRPLADIKLNINVPDLDAMIAEVVETISTREREVQDRNERWYSLRVRPYRTAENKIDGFFVPVLDLGK